MQPLEELAFFPITDTKRGHIMLVNSMFSRMTGWIPWQPVWQVELAAIWSIQA